MNNELKLRLAKLRELAEKGSTEGERNAARKGMERIIKKFNLDEQLFLNTDKTWYHFRYNTMLEIQLLIQITDVLVEVSSKDMVRYVYIQEVRINVNYLDYITIECAYEYFRRHMKKEWDRLAMPKIRRCRKASTRNKKRAELQKEFFSSYIIASNLYKEDQLKKREKLSKSEVENALMFTDVEGGEYKKQVNNGLYLEE